MSRPLTRAQARARARPPEFVAHDETATITRFDAVGELVEGSVGPFLITNGNNDATTLTVHFHVCRAPDWRVPDR